MIYITLSKKGPFVVIKGKVVPKIVVTEPKPSSAHATTLENKLAANKEKTNVR